MVERLRQFRLSTSQMSSKHRGFTFFTSKLLNFWSYLIYHKEDIGLTKNIKHWKFKVSLILFSDLEQYGNLFSVAVCAVRQFINYDTDYMCVWEHSKEIIFGYIWSDLHLIFHFHDEHKSWWSSILNRSVADANRDLYILVLILPELVIDCFEL